EQRIDVVRPRVDREVRWVVAGALGVGPQRARAPERLVDELLREVVRVPDLRIGMLRAGGAQRPYGLGGDRHLARGGEGLRAGRRVTRYEGKPQQHPSGRNHYFAAAGNAGSLPMSRMSCWMMTVAFTFPTICFIRSIEAIVAARSKLNAGTPLLS